MRRRIGIATLILPAVVTSAACGARDGSPDEVSEQAATTTVGSSPVPDRTLPPERRPEPVPPISEPPAVTGQVPDALLDEIIADASDRTGVEPAAIVTVQAQAVTWPDGSLGCPEPDVAYTQALVPGHWVVLDVGGTMLDYRVGRAGSFILCDSALGTPPPGVNPSS